MSSAREGGAQRSRDAADRVRTGLSPTWRKALATAEALQAASPSIVAVGIGFKHSRTARYGKAPRRCIKFLVRRKRTRPVPAERIPRWITVKSGGRTTRIATDVESMQRIAPQAERVVCRGRGQAAVGSVGFVARDGGGRLHVVTAGHTFVVGGNLLANGAVEVGEWDRTPVDCPDARRAAVTQPTGIGSLHAGVAYFADAGGLLVDVAVIDLAGAVPDLLRVLPWTLPAPAVRSLASLAVDHESGAHLRFAVYAASGVKKVRFDGLYVAASGGMTVDGNPPYATPLVAYRPEGAALFCGDSGASVLSEDGRELVGVHVLGDRSIGYAVPAETALDEILRVSGLALTPVSV